MPSPILYRQRSFQYLVLLLITTVIFNSSEAGTRGTIKDMINGIWIVETMSPINAVELCDEYLPTGTRIRFQILGPTRLAIEEQRVDELGGVVELAPPISSKLCGVGLGQTTVFGNNLCQSGQLRESDEISGSFEADFVFSRMTKLDLESIDNIFFAEQGARVGANLVTVTVNYKAVQWDLWLRSTSEMVSECVFVLPGKNNIDSFPMIWRRQF